MYTYIDYVYSFIGLYEPIKCCFPPYIGLDLGLGLKNKGVEEWVYTDSEGIKRYAS